MQEVISLCLACKSQRYPVFQIYLFALFISFIKNVAQVPDRLQFALSETYTAHSRFVFSWNL